MFLILSCLNLIACGRHKQLESILVVTQQFHETLEPLSEWLAATEKHLANSEPIGTETSKLEDQISQHKVISITITSGLLISVLFILLATLSLSFSSSPISLFVQFPFHFCVFCVCFPFVSYVLGPFPIIRGQALEEGVMNHSKDLFQAVSLGQTLKSLSSVDEKEFVQSKLDTTQANYIELQERCRRKADMLQQALANAQLFGEDEVALMNWLNEVHPRLSEVSVEDYKIDVLEKQLAEQRVYTPPQASHYAFLLSCIDHLSVYLIICILCTGECLVPLSDSLKFSFSETSK